MKSLIVVRPITIALYYIKDVLEKIENFSDICKRLLGKTFIKKSKQHFQFVLYILHQLHLKKSN